MNELLILLSESWMLTDLTLMSVVLHLFVVVLCLFVVELIFTKICQHPLPNSSYVVSKC